jgi:hypothetical protein
MPPAATGFGNAKTGEFEPAWVEEIDAPVRECRPYQTGRRIDHEAELVLRGTLSWRHSITLGCATPEGAVYWTLVLVCRAIEESEVGLARHRSVTIVSSKTGFWLEEFSAPTLLLGTPAFS